MADQLGVNFEEVDARVGVTPAGAFLPAIVGRARRGRTDKNILVRSWAEYETQYGGLYGERDLGQFYWDFLRNGGGAVRCLRLVGTGAEGASNTAGLVNKAGSAVVANVHAANEGAWGNDLSFSTVQYKKAAAASPAPPDASDASANALPNSTDNVLSADTGRQTLASILGIRVGDILDVFDSATGALDNSGPIMVVGLDATTNDIFFINPTGDFLANSPDTPSFKCASMHRASTLATEALAAGALNIELQSTEGIKRGALLTFSIFSHVPSLASRGYAQRSQAVVERVVGRRVYFVAATANGAAIPASKSAFLRYIASGSDGIDFTARAGGTGGNQVSISIAVAAAANSVTVTGRHIAVARTAAAKTTAAIIAAIEADAAANALVSCALLNDSVSGTALATTFLAGGAVLQVVSQEWGLTIKEAGTQQEKGKHQYLSLLDISPDYIGRRISGTTSPLALATNNPSLLLFLAGDSATTDTAANELARLPASVEDLALAGGEDGNDLTDDQLIGTAEPRTGIHLLDGLYDIRAVAVPGVSSPNFQKAAAEWAQAHGGVTFVLDAPEADTTASAVAVHREISLGLDNGFVQLFWPWGVILDPRPSANAGDRLNIPPSPAVLATMVKAVREGGQHASIGNYQIPSWVDLTVAPSDSDNNYLNNIGVCVIRPFTNRGIRIFGDRTLLQANTVRRAGNVRRWLSYFKASLKLSLGGLPFKTINTRLFRAIEGGVGAFLFSEWQKGALYPDNNASQAYFVLCNGDTTTTDDITAFRVVAQVGVSPAPFAEEILFKINISSGGVRFEE